MITRRMLAVAAIGAVLVAACSSPEPDVFADTIYTGGDVVTMNPAQPTAEAVAVAKGKILAVGARAEIESAYMGAARTRSTESPAATRVIDLAGKTLLPGFIDSHSHYFQALSVANPKPTRELVIERTRDAQMLYAQAGITTAHEGATQARELEMMQHASASGANIIDVVAFPLITDLDRVLATNPVSRWGTYINRLKIGGVKITADGSPQDKAAYFTKPYLTGGPGGEPDWRGEPTFPQERIEQMVARVYELGVPLNVHANGDAAIDAFLAAHERAAADDPTKDRHVTLIDAQFARADQLEKFVRCRIVPSFFTLHTYFFAEAHIANRGPDEATFMSPMRAAIDMGIRVTNHTDFVVAPLDQMLMLWSAVNRVSRAGATIGADQRVTPLEGLQAMTINAAHQYGEAASKGTIEPGKLADLVVLDRNPLKVDSMHIKDIHVVETIKEGITIYTRTEP